MIALNIQLKAAGQTINKVCLAFVYRPERFRDSRIFPHFSRFNPDRQILSIDDGADQSFVRIGGCLITDYDIIHIHIGRGERKSLADRFFLSSHIKAEQIRLPLPDHIQRVAVGIGVNIRKGKPCKLCDFLKGIRHDPFMQVVCCIETKQG